jgi:sensor histidine kinase YesM
MAALLFNRIGKIIILLFVSVCCFMTGFPNNPDSLVMHQHGVISTRVYSTVDEFLKPELLSDSHFDSAFHFPATLKTLSPRKFYWFKLDFQDIDLSGSKNWVVRLPPYDHIILYFRQGDTLNSMVNGWMEPHRSNSPYYAVDFTITADELIEGRYLLARIQHITRKTVIKPGRFMHPYKAGMDRVYYTRNDLREYTPYVLFIGGMLLMILYSFGIYFMNRDKLFNYYAIYLVSLVLYLGVRLPPFFGPLEVRYPLMMHLYNELIQVSVNIFYLLFASFFLNSRHDYPGLHRAITYAIRFLSGIMVLQLLLILSVRFLWVEVYVIQIERYFMIIFSLIVYIHILRNYKNKTALFLIIGSLFFLAGGVLAMYLQHIKYMMLGAATEVFIFSLGMGYRIKQVEQTRQSIENEMNKLRLTALRAQMNPHFIFNSLNSIRAYVISNEKKNASDFLNKFARLIRLILHYSSKDNITLKEELEAVTLYVELEQMRYRENFGFVMTVGEDIIQNKLLIPPLILQPYIENAIIHGLAPKSGEKRLLIEITRKEQTLQCVIRDNGVGRQYSANAHTNRNPQFKSVALEMTRKRIELAEDNFHGNENIKIIDLMDEGQPAGTEVRLKLPLKTAI